MTTTVEQNMALLRTAYQLVESSELDEAAQMLTENFVANVPGSPDPLHGREIWQHGTKIMKDAFPDLKIDVQDMFGVGDKVTVLVHFRGTHRGAFQQFEATGRQVGYRSVEVYRFEGGRIAEEWVAPDLMSLMQQISPTAAGH
ncbi:ester cyclase [Streptomyces anulatus]|uniref:ester cyclase n=1 Tax=Streptomyces anulatus TaxID=1892 RepID=UPI0032557853|nr:ester cyclase [Streptomyces anulatus]WSU27054.1 ester cyclase [Streptomyces anulatus]WSU94043.1 ester cyclase [Streptomyces anulatus]WSW81016.1 ester cyclase [Streptomyces anulatus]